VCCGHSHAALIEHIDNVRGGHTLMINPGTVAGLSAPSTYAIGDLGTGEFRIA
jgi:predicted phosphodiesterase